MRDPGNYYLKICSALLALALLLSCDRHAKTVAADVPVDPFSIPTPRARYANDVGRFLAGLSGTPGSPFEELEKNDAWIEHRRELDKAWNGIEAHMLPAMRKFQSDELGAAAIEKSIAFYPFSGPDALAITTFFPKCPTYIMVGLEPPGTLPPLNKLSADDLSRKLPEMRATVYDELHRSFFITHQMDKQFRGQVTDGLFLPILQLLARTGRTVLGYRYVRIDEQGDVVERDTANAAPDKGIELDFLSEADQSVHKLFYFSINLSDVKMRQNKPFLAFLNKLKPVSSYFKATSYMTHKPQFSMIRERVLAKSVAILQDDSGIPYRYFPAAWSIQVYGDYVRPYASFRWLEQPDLRKAYAGKGVKPLDFQIGYGFKRIPSNLLLATRGNPAIPSSSTDGRSPQ